MFADLHNHTTASDGEYTPTELVAAAHRLGTRFVGVTDHDTLEGVLSLPKEALYEGGVVPGTEVTLRFSAEEDGYTGTCHCLVYVPPALLASPDFVADARATLAQARGPALVAARVARLNACYHGPDALAAPLLAAPVTTAEVAALPGAPTRRHLHTVLTRNHGLDDATARTMLANDSPAYLPSGVTCAELRPFFARHPQLVRVLAHPGAGSARGPAMALYREVLPPVDVVERLVPRIDAAVGLDGVEVHYPAHDAALRARVLGLLRERPFLVTGGSDCHDRVKRPLGKAGLDERAFDALRSRLFGPS